MWGQARSPEPTTLQPPHVQQCFRYSPCELHVPSKDFKIGRGGAPTSNSISPVATPKKLANTSWPPRIQRSVLVSVAKSKGDYKVRRLGLVKFQGARSVVTPLPEGYDLGRLHPC